MGWFAPFGVPKSTTSQEIHIWLTRFAVVRHRWILPITFKATSPKPIDLLRVNQPSII